MTPNESFILAKQIQQIYVDAEICISDINNLKTMITNAKLRNENSCLIHIAEYPTYISFDKIFNETIKDISCGMFYKHPNCSCVQSLRSRLQSALGDNFIIKIYDYKNSSEVWIYWGMFEYIKYNYCNIL